jgi:hypothetical protein
VNTPQWKQGIETIVASDREAFLNKIWNENIAMKAANGPASTIIKLLTIIHETEQEKALLERQLRDALEDER